MQRRTFFSLGSFIWIPFFAPLQDIGDLFSQKYVAELFGSAAVPPSSLLSKLDHSDVLKQTTRSEPAI